MSLKEIGILAITIVIIIAFFLSFSNTQKDPIPKLFIIEQPSQVKANETFTIKVRAIDETLISNVIYKTFLAEEQKKCEQKECTLEFNQSFDQPGTYQIELIAQNNIGKQVSKIILLKVLEDTQTCIDLTSFGECSEKKPFYCEEGKLIEKCNQCGCKDGFQCNLGECKVIERKLEIFSANPLPQKIIRFNTNFLIIVVLKNTENQVVGSGANYLIKAQINGANSVQTEKNISLSSSLLQNDTIEVELEMDGLKAGTYSLQLELFAQNKVLNSKNIENFVISSSDLTPPVPPTGLSYRLAGEGIELTWNPNSEKDLSGYRLFKSKSIDATHIKYSLLAEVDNSTTKVNIEDLPSGIHYFVLRAFDILDNKSSYSQSIRVVKG